MLLNTCYSDSCPFWPEPRLPLRFRGSGLEFVSARYAVKLASVPCSVPVAVKLRSGRDCAGDVIAAVNSPFTFLAAYERPRWSGIDTFARLAAALAS